MMHGGQQLPEHDPGVDLSYRTPGGPGSRRGSHSASPRRAGMSRDISPPHAQPAFTGIVRKDGRQDTKVQAVNAKMNSFVQCQASALTSKQTNPDAGIAGRLAQSSATGWAMKAMGFDALSSAPEIKMATAAARPQAVDRTPVGTARRTGGDGPSSGGMLSAGLKRADSFGRRAGSLLGFGSGRGTPGRGNPRTPLHGAAHNQSFHITFIEGAFGLFTTGFRCGC